MREMKKLIIHLKTQDFTSWSWASLRPRPPPQTLVQNPWSRRIENEEENSLVLTALKPFVYMGDIYDSSWKRISGAWNRIRYVFYLINVISLYFYTFNTTIYNEQSRMKFGKFIKLTIHDPRVKNVPLNNKLLEWIEKWRLLWKFWRMWGNVKWYVVESS